MQNSFHGRTFGAMALTTSKTYYRQGFAPLMPQVVVAPYPYCLHCKVRAAHPEGDSWYKVSLATPLLFTPGGSFAARQGAQVTSGQKHRACRVCWQMAGSILLDSTHA